MFILKYVFLFLGELFYILGFYKFSLYFYSFVYRDNPKDLECLEMIISCNGYLGNYDSVIEYSDKFLKIDKNNFDIYYFKAQALFIFERYEESLKYYDLALDIDSDNVLGLMGKTNVLLKLDEDELFILKKGKNAKVNTVPKHAKLYDYKLATAFEALVGYLYLLGNNDRLNQIFEIIYKGEDKC